MLEQEIIDAVAAKIGTVPTGDAETIAATYVKLAVLKVGRTRGVSWNREAVEETLESGESQYKVGADILTDYVNLRNLQSIFCTDAPNNPIKIIGVNEFGHYARGSASSGRPTIATLHSGETTLEFWPEPDDNYAIWLYLRKKIENFADIPEDFHDVVFSVAMALISSPAGFAKQGIKEIQEDSLTTWDGNTIPISRHIGQAASGTGSDSGNLRGR